METRIIYMESFTVKGFEMKGPISEIPKLWDRLSEELQKYPNVKLADESFGITIAIEDGFIHYLAGIKKEHCIGIPDLQEIVIPNGKFIVADVLDGIESIPYVFSELINKPGIRIRESFGLERYIHALGAEAYTLEVLMAIE